MMPLQLKIRANLQSKISGSGATNIDYSVYIASMTDIILLGGDNR